MNRNHTLIVGLLLVIVVGMFIFAYLKRADYSATDGVSVAPIASTTPLEITSIDAKHYFTEKEGVHTLAGEIAMPTACDLLRTSAVLLDNGTRAVVSFDVINNSETPCEPMVTAQRFKAGFEAPENIKIEAVFKGKPVKLNLIPAAPGEDPADFELFIKG